ncbi:hypothetical protein ES703_05403 [subsurface metagenome]
MKEQLQELLAVIEENESRGIKLVSISRLWVMWNAKEMSADEFIRKLTAVIKKEIGVAWQDFCKGASDHSRG